MNSRTLKLLTASTAFVAVAASGNAASISTTVTTSINTSNSTPVSVTSTGFLNVAGAPAIQISSTNAVSNTINVSTGGRIQGVSSTIESINTANALVTINNSGTIVNTGVGASGKAIDLAGMTNGATIRNVGTISGSITFGDGTNNFSSTGTTSGAITGGTGADNFTFTGATHTGAINLGDGVNNLAASASSLGSITAGAAATSATLTNTTVSGAIDLGAGGDGDVLTINGTNTFTTRGTINNVETINFDTNTNVNNLISGANAVTVGANKTLTVANGSGFALSTLSNGVGSTINANDNITGTGLLTNNGAINIAAGKTVQANTLTSGAGSSVGIAVASSSSTGKLGFLTNNAANTSLTINMGANSGFITSGTRISIISGTTGTATVLNANTGVYRFSTVTSNNSTSLVVGRVATASVVAGSDNKAVAAALDKNTTNTNAALTAVHGAIGQQTTAAGVNNVVDSLTPSIDGAGLASVNVTVDTGNQVSNRLASVRSTSGVATGDALASQHMWVQGFGSTVEQDDKGGNAGYDASAGGMSIGVDTDTLVDGFTTGVAFSYGRGKVDSNASSNASTDIDSYIATVYASQVLDSGVFLNGQLAGGYNKYDMTRNIIGVGTAKGDTDAFQGSAKLEAGKDFAAGGFTLTPLASLQYTYLNMDKYTETGAGGASLTVDPEALSTVDAGAGGQVAYAIPLADGATLKPSAHAKYIYRMGDTEMGTTSSFTGGTGSFNTSGVKADRASVNLGAGLLLTTVGGTDLSLNYDADIRSNLTGHTGQLKARWAF